MSNAKQTGEIAKDYLSRYPDTPTRALARMMRKDHPKVFTTSETARTRLRYLLGSQGEAARKKVSDKRFMLPKATRDNPFSIPQSMSQEWLPYVLPDSLKSILVMGDIHAPFHDVAAVSAAIGYARDHSIDCVVLNGDIIDCYALSRFDKNPEIRNFPKERESTVQLLTAIRAALPSARIVYKEGNHDARFGDILKSKAPDLYGLSEFRLPVILDLYNLGIDWVDMKRPIQYRELDILHGHELPAKTGGVNPARTALLKSRSCVLVSHYHRKSGDMQTTLRGAHIQSWSIGCMCEMHPQYMPVNDWCQGFAHITGGDDWSVRNLSVIAGRIV